MTIARTQFIQNPRLPIFASESGFGAYRCESRDLSFLQMRRFLILLFALVFSASLFAEEGMWTFDNLPLQALKEKYDFTPSQQWLDHLRLSCTRFSDGGSGSFISPDG